MSFYFGKKVFLMDFKLMDILFIEKNYKFVNTQIYDLTDHCLNFKYVL